MVCAYCWFFYSTGDIGCYQYLGIIHLDVVLPTVTFLVVSFLLARNEPWQAKVQRAAFLVPLLLIGQWFGRRVMGVERKDRVEAVSAQAELSQSPLRFEVDFIDQKDGVTIVDTEQTVETKNGTLKFSTAGGALTQYVYHRGKGDARQDFELVDDNAVTQDTRGFLVAFDANTPLHYTLQKHDEDDEAAVLVYVVDSADVSVEKRFMVYKKLAKIDVALTVIPHHGVQVSPRLIWQSPVLKELGDKNAVGSIALTRAGAVEKVPYGKIAQKTEEIGGYARPAVFGAENKYFLAAMIEDDNGFVKRAYCGVQNMAATCYAQPETVTEKTSWKLSFYLGPKIKEEVVAVDARLSKFLNYGILYPLTRVLMMGLDWLYRYTHNYGFAIIILTILLNFGLSFFTFRRQYEGIKKMTHQAQKMDYIKMRYKDDPIALREAQMELLKKEGMPMGGMCLAQFIQLPFFLALQSGLNNMFELYRAPFAWWLTDLSMPDTHYVLITIFIAAMLLNNILTSPKQSARQRLGSFALTVLFGSFLSAFSSGVLLYVMVSGIYRLVESSVARRVL